MLGGHLRVGRRNVLALCWRAAIGGCRRLTLCMAAKWHILVGMCMHAWALAVVL